MNDIVDDLLPLILVWVAKVVLRSIFLAVISSQTSKTLQNYS